MLCFIPFVFKIGQAQLLKAAEEGDEERVRTALSRGADVLHCRWGDPAYNAARLAKEKGHHGICQFLKVRRRESGLLTHCSCTSQEGNGTQCSVLVLSIFCHTNYTGT